MNKILWAQARGTDKRNVIIIDGLKENYNGSEKQLLAMGKLIEVRSWPCLPVIAENRSKYTKGFEVALDENKGLTIRSFYESDGSMFPFTYYSASANLDEALEDLSMHFNMLGFELNTSDFSVLAAEMDNYKPRDINNERERLKALGGGFEKLWQYVRRH